MHAEKSDKINIKESLLKHWPTSNWHRSLMQVCYKIEDLLQHEKSKPIQNHITCDEDYKYISNI